MRLLIFLFLALTTIPLYSAKDSTQLFSTSYGDPGRPAIIFLHGGPGYNSYSFELTTAQQLADSGFFVIIYDRRGCGRSASALNPQYTFEQATADLDSIYLRYFINRATLLCHNFGGLIGLKYAEYYSYKVDRLILNNVPVNYMLVDNDIRDIMLKEAEDSQSYADNIATTLKQDSLSLIYHRAVFGQYFGLGYYYPPSPSEECRHSYSFLQKNKDPLLTRTDEGEVRGFYNREAFNNRDFSNSFKVAKSNEVKIFGIYGDGDVMFGELHRQKLRDLIGENNMVIIPDARYNTFLEQKTLYLNTVIEMMKK